MANGRWVKVLSGPSHDIRPSFVNLRLETDEGTDGFNATCLIASERITG